MCSSKKNCKQLLSKEENASAIVGLYLSFQTITNIHRQQCPPQCSHCSHRMNPSKLFSAALFHFIQNTIWRKLSLYLTAQEEIIFSKMLFEIHIFLDLPYFWFFFRSGKLVCLSSGAAAYRSTMEHFPRTCLSMSSLTKLNFYPFLWTNLWKQALNPNLIFYCI